MMFVKREIGPAITSVDFVRKQLGRTRPVTLTAMLKRYKEPIVIDQPLVTDDGVALGGHHTITLNRNGSFRHKGHMRATGWPSYNFGVRTVVNTGVGVPAVLAASGTVHGTNESGDREHSWDILGENPLLAYHWSLLKTATHNTEINYSTDWFGTVGDVATFVGELVAGAYVAGPAGVCILLGVHAADAAGADELLGTAGLAGVVVAGTVLVIYGPSAIVPAIVAGIGAGVAVELAIKHRRMTGTEVKFADKVFKGTLPVDRIVLTNLLGVGSRPFTMPSIGDAILVNLGAGYDNPIAYSGFGDSNNPNTQAPGQLFIHELTHAWQIEHSRFLPGMMCGALLNQSTTLGGNMDVYKYGPSGPAFGDFNLEQQASIVDDWFGGSGPQAGQQVEDDSNPYFRYIRDNIRARIV